MRQGRRLMSAWSAMLTSNSSMRQIAAGARLAEQNETFGRLRHRMSPSGGPFGYSTSPCSSRARQAPQLPLLQLCGKFKPASSAASSTGWSGAALKLRSDFGYTDAHAFLHEHKEPV